MFDGHQSRACEVEVEVEAAGDTGLDTQTRTAAPRYVYLGVVYCLLSDALGGAHSANLKVPAAEDRQDNQLRLAGTGVGECPMKSEGTSEDGCAESMAQGTPRVAH